MVLASKAGCVRALSAPPVRMMMSSASAPPQFGQGQAQKSRRPDAIRESIKQFGYKHFCPLCNCGFDKEKQFVEHVAGKAHRKNEAGLVELADRFRTSAPGWHDEDTAEDITAAWSMNELDDFPMRATCLEPGTFVSALPPRLKARFWRYLSDRFGQHSPELCDVFHAVDQAQPQFMRVKELFESIEAFRVIEKFVLTANQQGRDINQIFDLACGHGLVGILLAYRFPHVTVTCVDLERRPAFQVYSDAWHKFGDRLPGWTGPLQNVQFIETDLNTVVGDVDARSCVVALHACNEANRDVVDLAVARNATWVVMPCCLRTKSVLTTCSIDLSDNDRYALLCGALAQEYGAQLLRMIDRRITARPFLIGGGLTRETWTIPAGSSSGTSTSTATAMAKPPRAARPRLDPRRMPQP